MSKRIPVVMWALVAIAAAIVILLQARQNKNISSSGSNAADQQGNIEVDSTGRAFATVPWKHLPDIDRFKLIDQNGDRFDSAELNGQAYVVSFFFATCPTFCLDLNKELDRVNSALRDTDIRFLTITVDPKNDTPDVLNKYAAGFDATPDRWAFLTGQMHQLVEIGDMFDAPVDPETHSDNIFLVDKWGRYRDRFKWDQPYDMKRLVAVAKEVAAESEPPLEETIKTRNVLAGFEPKDPGNVRWIREFHLTERSGEKFYSRDLIGEVWIANFFFSTCPGICQKQSEYLRDLQQRLGDQAPKVVSITTDSQTDTPEVLREYATKLDADPEQWLFCTGDGLFIKRIGGEYFHAHAEGGHHSSLLYVVDRWGTVRGKFDWEKPGDEIEMLRLIKELKNESRPPQLGDPPKPSNPELQEDTEEEPKDEADE